MKKTKQNDLATQVEVKICEDSSGYFFSIHKKDERPIKVHCDFKMRAGIGLKTDILAKAIGFKKNRDEALQILDLTAGLCRDAFHLACLGNRVTALECNKELFDVCSQEWDKMRASHPLIDLKILNQRALQYLEDIKIMPDVIYYDPMFPEKKKSAQAGKESELLKLLGHYSTDEEEQQLLDLSLQRARLRVVVKRPLSAQYIRSRHKKFEKPQLEIKGKAVRYDVYILHKLTQKNNLN